ncbi:MAG: hypothetical protein HIU91_01730 [Acidobacteria bacterium]|nr:hypothetical protein [Acidobacteriota bacterium]
MDRVRFGRALGYGARHAAQSLKKAAEAANAPNPQPASARHSAEPVQPLTQPARVAHRVVQTRRKVATTKTHAKTLGRSVWSPLAQFSSVLWLQVTGTFFTLLALFLSEGLWKNHASALLPWHTHAARIFYLQLLAFLAFTYFAISNFVRAHLRGRR